MSYMSNYRTGVTCRFCRRWFKVRRDLDQHMERYHPREHQRGRELSCRRCSKKWTGTRVSDMAEVDVAGVTPSLKGRTFAVRQRRWLKRNVRKATKLKNRAPHKTGRRGARRNTQQLPSQPHPQHRLNRHRIMKMCSNSIHHHLEV